MNDEQPPIPPEAMEERDEPVTLEGVGLIPEDGGQSAIVVFALREGPILSLQQRQFGVRFRLGEPVADVAERLRATAEQLDPEWVPRTVELMLAEIGLSVVPEDVSARLLSILSSTIPTVTKPIGKPS